RHPGVGQFPHRPYRQQCQGLRLMTAMNKTTVFAVTFTVSFAVLYAICTEFNLPLVSYHPVIGELDFLRTPERRGPVIVWYGSIPAALVRATILAFLATMIPESWLQRIITFGAAAAVAYLIVYGLALFVYEKVTVELEWLKSRWLSAGAAVVLA